MSIYLTAADNEFIESRRNEIRQKLRDPNLSDFEKSRLQEERVQLENVYVDFPKELKKITAPNTQKFTQTNDRDIYDIVGLPSISSLLSQCNDISKATNDESVHNMVAELTGALTEIDSTFTSQLDLLAEGFLPQLQELALQISNLANEYLYEDVVEEPLSSNN